MPGTSAGVGALNGHPMHPYAAEVLIEHKYDSIGFESRYLTPRILAPVDIVLCLTREHRAACQRMLPARWKRMFTLIEFTELAEIGELDDIMGARNRVDTNSPDLDITDPMGQPKEAFEQVFSMIEPRVRAVVDWLMAVEALTE